MGNQTESARVLAFLLAEYGDRIASTWAELTYRNASFRPGEHWRDILIKSWSAGLQAAIDYLVDGNAAALETYLTNLSHACLRSGYEMGEVTEALLLCKDAVLPVIAEALGVGGAMAWAVIGELDTCLRWMVRQFNAIYAAEANSRLKRQHEHIMRMLRLGSESPGMLEIDVVLRSIAEGIIDSIENDHCHFYLVDTNANRLLPMVGISRTDVQPEMTRLFLDSSPDLTTDVFLRQVLEQKAPLVSSNAQLDTRVNRNLIGAMGTKSILAVPLIAHDRVLAIAVTGTFDEFRTFTEEQIELAWDVAKAGTLLIENARLNAARLAESQSIQRGISALLQELELEEVLKIVCTETQRLTGAQDSAAYLLQDDDWLQLFFSMGELPIHERIPTEQSLTGAALRERKTMLTNTPGSDQRLFRTAHTIRNMLIAPLIANGRRVGALYAASKPTDFDEEDARIVGIFADQAAIAIENARLQEQLRQMAKLEERERLAREIHDNLAQALSILKLQASNIGDLLRAGQVEQAQTFLAEMIKTAGEAHADAREAIFSLRHSASSPAEFIAGLKSHLEHYRRTYGLDAQLVIQEADLNELPANVVVQLSRIIQEALTNVRKHASASAVVVRLEKAERSLTVTVEDNGQGFDFDPANRKENGGVGLQIMRERTESLGGVLTIAAQPGHGTRVVAQLPL